MGVDGMTCQNCQRHVENALNTLPDTLAEVNLSARNVTVWTKADADEEAIRKAIRDAGYLPPLQAGFRKRASLPGFCRDAFTIYSKLHNLS